MNAPDIDTSLVEFARAVGHRAAMAGTFRVNLYDFEPILDSVRHRLGPLLSAEEVETLRRASHELARAVGRDRGTTVAHDDFRTVVDRVKRNVVLRSLGAEASPT